MSNGEAGFVGMARKSRHRARCCAIDIAGIDSAACALNRREHSTWSLGQIETAVGINPFHPF